MLNRSSLLLPLFALVLMGQGCFGASVNTDNEPLPLEDKMEQDAIRLENEGTADIDLNAGGNEVVEEAPAPSGVSVDMTAGNFFFAPDTITAAPGEQVTVSFDAVEDFHTFVIDAIGLKAQLQQGGTVTFTAPSTPGSYPFYCDIANHQALGMEGMLIVR